MSEFIGVENRFVVSREINLLRFTIFYRAIIAFRSGEK